MKKLLATILVMGLLVAGATTAFAAEAGPNANCPNDGVCVNEDCINNGECVNDCPNDGVPVQNRFGNNGENRGNINRAGNNGVCENSELCPNDGVRPLDGTGYRGGQVK